MKDAKIVKKSTFYQKTKELLSIIRENPFQTPPKYEKLVGIYKGAYSRRINIQHRLVYEVIESEYGGFFCFCKSLKLGSES